ncbi:MAG: YceI family protein [Alphaproteobacteria bacterium]|nr:YceI family protein [Alphaproteobacteria bacterium]
MRNAIVGFSALALVVVAADAQSVSGDAKQAPTGRYALETHHSQVLFSIVHQGITDYYGRFDKLSGTMNFDAAQPEKSSVSVTIDMSSVDTPSAQLNMILGGSEVFGAQRFPSATYISTSVVRTGSNTGRIRGNLTIKNITKPVTLDVVFRGGNMNPMSDSYTIGFTGTTTIKRTDFGITGMRWEPLVSDDVKLIIEAMFEQQKG